MIDFDKPLSNSVRKFGEASSYYAAYVRSRGRVIPALFTEHELRDAIFRAEKQTEFDLNPPRRNSIGVTAFLAFLFGFLVTAIGVVVL